MSAAYMLKTFHQNVGQNLYILEPPQHPHVPVFPTIPDTERMWLIHVQMLADTFVVTPAALWHPINLIIVIKTKKGAKTLQMN